MPETPDDLISISDVRLILGSVSRARADQISRSKGFPEPARSIPMGNTFTRLWLRSDVVAYQAQRTTSEEDEG